MQKIYFLSYFLLLACSTFLYGQKTYDALIYEGNRDFENKKYEKSAVKNLEAIKKDPQNFKAQYNLGNSLYKSGNYKEAEIAYEKAKKLAKNPKEKSAVLHNLGNTHFSQKNTEKAAENFKNALKLNPQSEETRKNLEIALQQKKQKEQNKEKQSKENQTKENQKPSKDSEKKDNPKKPGNQPENKEIKNGKNPQDSGENKNEKNGKQSGGSEPSNQNKGAGNENNPGNKEESNKIPKGLQEAILNRAANRERQTAQKIINKKGYSSNFSKEKDW